MSSTLNLSQARPGDRCLVLGVADESAELRSRLYALGVIPGALVQILRTAPLGDPLQIRVGTTLLSIRRTEAAAIAVDRQ